MTDIQYLIQQLTNNDTKTRDQARADIVKLGSQAVEPLIAALNTPSVWQRKSIVTLLQQIDDSRVIQPLVNLLKDEDAPTRGLAALALAHRQEQSAIPVLQQMADQETDAFARGNFVEAVAKLGQHDWVLQYAKRVLTESRFDNKDRQAMIQMLLRLKDPSTVDLMREVFLKREFGVWDSALKLLKEFKDTQTVDLLIDQLKDNSPQIRAGAAYSLGDFGDQRAVEPIKALLGDKTIAWQGDRPGEPSTTVDQAARDALKRFSSQPEDNSPSDKSTPEEKKPRWKFW